VKNAKARIIKRQGNDVEVTRYVSGSPITYSTKALIGRMNKQVTNMKQLESFKEGIFFPDSGIDGGDFVYNPAQDENYVVSGTHPEPYKNETISIVVNLLKCNHLLTVRSLQKVADTRGNSKNVLVDTYTGVPCFLEQVTNELRQMDAGIHPDTEYRIYTSAIDVKETDQVSVFIRAKEETFKVIALDYVTFPKMLIMEVCRDVRK
jgi:hypothetical protein